MVSSSVLSSDLAGGADTIVARATPAGRGALALIRVSGPQAADCASLLCPDVTFDAAWRAKLVDLHAASGEVLDRGIVMTFPGPRSYTGEDMFEVTVHGSPYLTAAVIEAIIAAGARPAGAGEFTRRAVANGKLDLVQAEAIADMVAADTEWQHRNARLQLAGDLSRRFAELRASLVTALGAVEASLDYEAQGIEVAQTEIAAHLDACRRQLTTLLGTARAGTRIRDGLRVVILGRPNSGKSTLFNTLCGMERAIVSPQPGTTRDLIEADLEVAGVRMTLQDTAGLRLGGGEVESEGHRRARAAAAAADVAIVLWPFRDGDGYSPPPVDEGPAVIQVRSKADLAGNCDVEDGWLRLSCHSGEGLEALRSELESAALGEIPDLGGSVAIARRHLRALIAAAAEIEGCNPASAETSAEGLRWALRSVDLLIGEVAPDEVLDEVFSAFCIGK
jgi:tRNA modification GTPase